LGDGIPPTIHCFHQSCSEAVAAANKTLRRTLALTESAKIPATYSYKIPKPVEQPKIQINPITPPAPCGGMMEHLNACFRQNENVAIVPAEGPEAKPIRAGHTFSDWSMISPTPAGTFIRVNPMLQGGSKNDDVAEFRHALLESDSAPLDIQWAAILASRLPVSAVIFSGSKSLHAWVKVDAENASEFKARAKKAADALERYEGMKIDRACLNPSRLSRLAGVPRGEMRQTLIATHLGATSWEEWLQPEEAIQSEPESNTPAGEMPFIILGQLDRTYYYLSRTTSSLIALTSSQHTRNSLLELAPLEYWESRYEGKGDAMIHKAVDDLLQTAGRIEFDPSFIRGRGAWLDEGRVIYHAGNKAYVNSVETDLLSVESKYIYSRSARINADLSDPLPSSEAYKVREILSCFQFQNPLDHILLGGWLVCANICGALDWRPHCWLTGAAGSGKTTILSSLIEPLLGDFALAIQGNTTEAGIRQTLGHDARPVLFDEAEGDDESSKNRMAAVVALARASSRESGAVMLKGSAGGQAQSYRIRSCFMFSSVGVSLEKKADQGRISVIELVPEHLRTGDKYPDAKRIMGETVIRPEWCRKWRARCIKLAEVINHNAQIFKQACHLKLDEQRSADQIGTLIAGAYALSSNSRITIEAAQEWVDKHDWTFARPDKGDTDEQKLLNRLMESWVKVDTIDGRDRAQQTVSETVAQAMSDDEGRARWAKTALERIGIRVFPELGIFDVANSGTELAKRFNTPRWVDQLRRFKGAEKRNSDTSFGGLRKRCTRLPLSLIFY
jgi:putative DNA primase/helicase